METSIFCFATDFADERIETVLDNVQARGGLGGVTVAAAYHEGRDRSSGTRAREEIVSSLTAEVAAAAGDHGAELELIGLSGAVKGYATGRPAGAPAPSIS